MSLRRNIVASYASQLYVLLVGIVAFPALLKYMGAESFGLVGFFMMLSTWFQLLDCGLAPTMSREAARYSAGVSDAITLRRLLRALEGVFVVVGGIGCATMILGAEAIATRWLNVERLPVQEVTQALSLMAFVIALRFVSALYKGAVTGFERIVWLGGINVIIATLRFVVVIPFLTLVEATPTHFFAYQLCVGIIEMGLLVNRSYSLLPAHSSNLAVRWEWAPLRRVLRFSLSVAFTSMVWVLVTQTDKLFLSKLLPLTEYAYFTLVVTLASGVMMISGPISGALLPRMTNLNSLGDERELLRVYRTATQCIALIVCPVVFVLCLFPEQILWVWTGNAALAHESAQILVLYSLGNGFLAFAAFPYYLQFAKGNLRLHLIGNAVFLVFLIPSVAWATVRYGALGAGWAWMLNNAACLLFWVPFVHQRFAAGLHVRWLAHDILLIACSSLLVAAAGHFALDLSRDRWAAGAQLVALAIAVFLSGALGSSWLRGAGLRRWTARFGLHQ